jgi:hypothetical protein
MGHADRLACVGFCHVNGIAVDLHSIAHMSKPIRRKIMRTPPLPEDNSEMSMASFSTA